MAALHTGIYRPDRLPPEEWITAQYEMCRRYGEQNGNLIYVGLDSHFREVYSLGCRQHGGMVVRALQHINRIFHIEEQIHFIDAGLGEGRLPSLLQRSAINKSKYAKIIFNKWFQYKYHICLQEVQRVKQALKDGVN